MVLRAQVCSGKLIIDTEFRLFRQNYSEKLSVISGLPASYVKHGIV